MLRVGELDGTLHGENVTSHQYSIVTDALSFIHTLLGGSNPKRSFGVLVDGVKDKQKKSGGTTSTEADFKLQSHCWAHATVNAFKRLLLTQDRSDGLDSQVALLELTSENTQNGTGIRRIIPSYSDPDGELVSLLHFITKSILLCMAMDASTMNDRRTTYLISSIRTLLLLNHRLLCEELPKCISFSCSSLSILREGAGAQKCLILTVSEAYGELRQIGY